MDLKTKLYQLERDNVTTELRRALAAARKDLTDAEKAAERGEPDTRALYQLVADAAAAVRHGSALHTLGRVGSLIDDTEEKP